ncbi:MAG: permease [Desulfobacterales bacterium]|nr:permease [Desulfobacterales bacterium]
MKEKKTGKKIDSSLFIVSALILIAAAISFFIGGWQRVISGLTQGVLLMDKVWLRLLLGIVFAGLLQELVPHEGVAKWLGPTSGLKGILIGSYLGVFMTNAPYVKVPLIMSLYAAGAGIGPVIALLVGGEGLALQSLFVWQIPFLGVGISLSRYVVFLFIPPVVGVAGAAVYRLLPFQEKGK